LYLQTLPKSNYDAIVKQKNSDGAEVLLAYDGAFFGEAVMKCLGQQKSVPGWSFVPGGGDFLNENAAGVREEKENEKESENFNMIEDSARAKFKITAKSTNVKWSSFTITDFAATVDDEIAFPIVYEKLFQRNKRQSKMRSRSGSVLHFNSLEDFKVDKFLGQGSFGSVRLMSLVNSPGREYAVKQINKVETIESQNLEHTLDERAILARIDHLFICKLFAAFHTPNDLYFVFERIEGCDMYALLSFPEKIFGKRNGPESSEPYIPVKHILFYAANILEALCHLHSKGIAFRDLKPENVMVNANGYLKLIDFGLAKVVPYTTTELDDGVKTFMPFSFTMCGTPEYVAPELIVGAGHDHLVDLWALGMMLYELMHGRSLFYRVSEENDRYEVPKLFARITRTLYDGVKVEHHREFREAGKDGEKLAKLIEQLCQYAPRKRVEVATNMSSPKAHFRKKSHPANKGRNSPFRIGSGGGAASKCGKTSNLKQMDFFDNFDWEKLVEMRLTPPYVPKEDSEGTERFLEEEMEKDEVKVYEGNQDLFADFGEMFE
jgi:serine/threonine protein kinase